jgi:hypothetical protein
MGLCGEGSSNIPTPAICWLSIPDRWVSCSLGPTWHASKVRYGYVRGSASGLCPQNNLTNHVMSNQESDSILARSSMWLAPNGNRSRLAGSPGRHDRASEPRPEPGRSAEVGADSEQIPSVSTSEISIHGHFRHSSQAADPINKHPPSSVPSSFRAVALDSARGSCFLAEREKGERPNPSAILLPFAAVEPYWYVHSPLAAIRFFLWGFRQDFCGVSKRREGRAFEEAFWCDLSV